MEKKENKRMKKGLMIGALALLLGVVGYTGGQTFAKYITANSVPSTEATVAKWGYTVSVDATNLWGPEYVFDTSVSVLKGESTATLTVDSADTDNVVAPGTTGSTTLSIQGQAEVLSKLSVEATLAEVTLTKTEDDSIYQPLSWTISGTAKIGETNLLESTLTGKTAAEVEEFLDDLSETNIAANTTIDINLTISWAWAFSTDAETDVLDTYLGQIAAEQEVEGYTATLKTSYALKVTLEQLEKAE